MNDLSITPFTARLAAPVTTSFGVVDERKGFFFHGDGGDGEATPLPAFGTEDLVVCERVLRARGDDTAFAPCARHALEQARLRARGDVATQLALRVSLQADDLHDDVDRYELCAAADFDGALDAVLAAAAAGARTVKLKIVDAELARHLVRRVRSKLPSSALALRLDANGCLDLSSARWLLRSLLPGDIELIEQPVAADDVDGLVGLAADFGHVVVCADEALIDPARRKALLDAAAPLGFIWKPQAVGGATVVVDAVAARRDRVHIVTTFFDTDVAAAHATAVARVVDALCGVRRAHGLSQRAMLVS